MQEILTVKSDDVVGRLKTYESIVKGENIPEPGVPEGFKVLIKELQSLSLDIRMLGADNSEVQIQDIDLDISEKEKARELGVELPETSAINTGNAKQTKKAKPAKDLDDEVEKDNIPDANEA